MQYAAEFFTTGFAATSWMNSLAKEGFKLHTIKSEPHTVRAGMSVFIVMVKKS